MANHKRITSLSAEVIGGIKEQVSNGKTAADVANWLQSDLKLCLDVSNQTLKKAVSRYISQVIKPEIQEQIASRVVGYGVAPLTRNVGVLDSLNEAANIQKKRLLKIMKTEDNVPGVLLKQAREEMIVYKDVLLALSKVQLETGVLKRASKQTSGAVTDLTTGETREFSWTEEFTRLQETLDSRDIVNLEVVEDG